MTRVVVSIDPGLDLVAMAVFHAGFRKDDWRFADWSAKARVLFPTVERIATSPMSILQNRLHTVMTEVRDRIQRLRADLVIVEAPTVGGLYGRRAGTQMTGGKMNEGIMLSHFAVGAVVVGAMETDALVQLWKPPARLKKTERQERTRAILADAGFPGRRLGQDAIDAIAVGLFADWTFPDPLPTPIQV